MGLALNYSGFHLSPETSDMWEAFKSSYVVLGMMTLGLALAKITTLRSVWPVITVTVSGKFLLWPLVILALISLDESFFFMFDRVVHQIALLFAALPCATAGAIFASQLGVHPEKAAAAILTTTLIALVTVPLVPFLLSGG